MIRHSLVLSSLLLAGWTEPAGNFKAPSPSDNPAAILVVPKTAAIATADLERRTGPAETTGQLTEFGEDITASDQAAAPVAHDEPANPANPMWSDALASLDAVADEFGIIAAEPVPMPPRRVIPHTEVCAALASAAANNDLPPPFLIRLIWQESGFNQNAVSPVGAQGVAQFMPETAARRGLADPFNPLQAVRASARLLRDLIEQFGNFGFAAAAYNAGPRRVQDWLAKRGSLPLETRNYVERITGMKPEQWKGRTAAAPLRVPARAPCQREAGLYAADGPAQIPLPPTLAKAEPAAAVKVAAKPASPKASTATTKTVSAKAAVKTAVKTTARSVAKTITNAVSTTAKAAEVAPPKVAAQAPTKAAGKGHSKKVKLADAEARH